MAEMLDNIKERYCWTINMLFSIFGKKNLNLYKFECKLIQQEKVEYQFDVVDLHVFSGILFIIC